MNQQPRTHYCGQPERKYWRDSYPVWMVDRRRDHGGVILIYVMPAATTRPTHRDYPNRQRPQRTPESTRDARVNEYVVQITGRVTQRPEEFLTPACLRVR